jgi:prepilin-type N-terminal cleavage/methylation domain-containing protein
MQQKPSTRTAGFTLIELLVVLGIIAVLLGLLLPAGLRALRGGDRARLGSQLQSLEIAIAAYITDFGDLPRHFRREPRPNGSLRGAQSLARALLGPADAGSMEMPGSTAQPPAAANPGPYGDGLNGVGSGIFGRDGVVKPKPPYLQPNLFRTELRTGDTNYGRDYVLLDALGQPVLFYSKSMDATLSVNAAQPNTSGAKNGAYVGDALTPSTGPLDAPAADNVVMYNPGHNTNLLAADMFRLLMGDWAPGGASTKLNGRIDAGEQAAFTGPYVLWFAGSDRLFGLANTSPTASDQAINQATSSWDDVTSFRR